MDTFEIVRKHPHLVLHVDALQRANAEALSFYPTSALQREADKGRIFMGVLNGEPCGYIYAGAQGAEVRCHQVCIPFDARRRLYGAQLVVAVEDYATAGGATALRLRCGFDLGANDFWRALGYVCIRIEDGGVRRMRKINVWRKSLAAELFEIVGIEPATGRTSAAVWRRHKHTGLVSQFHRGASLTSYRQIITDAEAASE